MGKLARRVALRYMNRLTQARYKAPGKVPFPRELEPLARKWTAEAEANGHDLDDWKPGSSEERWQTRCLKCTTRYDIKRDDSGTWEFLEWNSGKLPEEDQSCNGNIVKSLARGMNIDPELLGAATVEALGSPFEIEAKLLALFKSKPVGTHWTSPNNTKVLHDFAKGFRHSTGLPVVVFADFVRADQPRKYRPHALISYGDEPGMDFTHERETYLGKNEKLRMTALDWFDGQKWHRREVSKVKIRA